MTGFLNSVFKGHSQRSRPTHPQSFASNSGSAADFSSIDRRQLPTEDLQALAHVLRQEVNDGGARDGSHLLRDPSKSENMQHLLDRLTEAESKTEIGRISPFSTDSGRQGKGKGKGILSKMKKGKVTAGGADAWYRAWTACEDALDLVGEVIRGKAMWSQDCTALLERISNLLEAQKDELVDLRGYAEWRIITTLAPLKDIYLKVSTGLEDLNLNGVRDIRDSLNTLVQVLQEGPDYLIDVTIIEAIIWQAEVIDPSLGVVVKQILDEAVKAQTDVAQFRRAAESIIAVTSALPRDALDDAEARDAYVNIGVLVKQLQARVALSEKLTSSSGPDEPLSRVPSPAVLTPSALVSPADTPPSSRSSSPDPEYAKYTGSDLEKRFGTGPTQTLTPADPDSRAHLSAVPPPAAASPSPFSTDSASIWEYKGNLLTRSALDLVQRQEALAMADSSGQYAGRVSWDDLRKAWIPDWAQKLAPGDVADGELPDTNPAGFVVKRKDAWHNQIGWRDGRMFYVDEPEFALKDD